MDRDSEQRLAIKRDFASFLDAEGANADGGASATAAGGIYAAKIGALLSVPGGVPARGARLDVDLQDLAGAAPDLHARLMADPADCIPAFEEVSCGCELCGRIRRERGSEGRAQIDGRWETRVEERERALDFAASFFFPSPPLRQPQPPLSPSLRPSTRSPARTTPRPSRPTRAHASAWASRATSALPESAPAT